MADNSVFLYKLDIGDKFTTTLDKNKVFEITGRKGDTTYVKEVKTGKESWFEYPDSFVIPVKEDVEPKKHTIVGKDKSIIIDGKEYPLVQSGAFDEWRFKNNKIYSYYTDGKKLADYMNRVTDGGKFDIPGLNESATYQKKRFKEPQYMYESAATRKIKNADDLYDWMTEYYRKNKSKGHVSLYFILGNGDSLIISWNMKSYHGIRHDSYNDTMQEFAYDYMLPIIRYFGISDIYVDDTDAGSFHEIKESRKGNRSMKRIKEAYDMYDSNEHSKKEFLEITKNFRKDIDNYLDKIERIIRRGELITSAQDKSEAQVLGTVFASELLRYNLAVQNKKLVESKKVLKEDGPQKIVIKNPWGVEVKDYKAGDPIPAGVKFKIFNANDTKKIDDYADSLFESTIYIKKGNQYFASLDGLPTWSNVKDLAMKYKSKDEAEKERQDLLNSFGYRDRELEVIEEGRIAKGYENLDASEKAKHLLSHPCSKYMGDLKSDSITERAIRKAVKEMLGKPEKDDQEFVDVVNEEGEAPAASTTTADVANPELPLKLKEGYRVIFPSGSSEKLKTIADVNKFVNGVLHMVDKNASDVQLTDATLDKWSKENNIPLVIVKESSKRSSKKISEGYRLVDQSTGASKSFSTIEELEKYIDDDQGLLEFPIKNDSDITRWNHWQKRDMGKDALQIVKESKKKTLKEESWSEINSIINDDVEEVEDEEGMNTAKRFKDAIYHGKNITPETYIRVSKNMRKSGSDNFWDLVEAVLSSDSRKIEKLIAKYDK